MREFFIDNLLVRVLFVIEMMWWTGLAPWEFEFPLPGSLTSTFHEIQPHQKVNSRSYRTREREREREREKKREREKERKRERERERKRERERETGREERERERERALTVRPRERERERKRERARTIRTSRSNRPRHKPKPLLFFIQNLRLQGCLAHKNIPPLGPYSRTKSKALWCS